MPEMLDIKLNLDKLRMSHILSMKEMFEAHRGKTPVRVHFVKENFSVAQVEIDQKWGVTPSDTLKELLNKLPTC